MSVAELKQRVEVERPAFEVTSVARFRDPQRMDEAGFWKRELGDDTYEWLAGRLEELGGDFERFALVPAHLWQANDLRERGFGKAPDSGALIPLGPAGDFYHATQSLRTFVNATHPEKANIKRPLDIVCTSSRRNLEPHFVGTAPLLSKWLVPLVAEDAFLQDGNSSASMPPSPMSLTKTWTRRDSSGSFSARAWSGG
jgi:siderophore synthetase component